MSSEVGMTPSASTVDRMVRAAVKHLHGSPVNTVNVREIAAEAGIDPAVAEHMFPDDETLDEAIGSYGIMKLSDSMNRALLNSPPGDNYAALKALARAYVRWALDNRELSYVLTLRLMQPDRTNSIVWKYDAGFVPLVRRFLGETDETASRRGLMARAFLFGVTDLAMHGHLELWKLKDGDNMAEVDAAIDDFIDLLLGKRPD